MRLRNVVIPLLVLLLLPVGGGAQETYCSTLSRADCNLYYRSDMDIPQSVSFKMVSDLVVEAGPDTVTMSVTATGSYTVTDPDALAPYQQMLNDDDALTSMSLADAQALFADAMRSADADLRLTLSVPESVSRGSFLSPVELGLWYVDGVGYIDLTPIGESFVDPNLAGTYGFDLVEALNFGFGLMDEEDWRGMMDVPLAEDTLETPLKEQLTLYEATTITRDDDGEGQATFRTRLDFLPLLALPSFRDEFYASQTTTNLSRDDIDAFADALGDTLETEGIIIEERVDLDTDHTISIQVMLDAALDTSAFVEQYAQASGDYLTFGEGGGVVDMALTVTIDRFDFNQVEAISPPAGADLISLFELFSLMGEGV